MKWILSHASDGIRQWQLQHENGSRSLNINLQRLSLRIAGISRRLFFLEVQGFLHKKLLLRSEYGFEIGETAFVDQPAAGSLVLNEQKFWYEAENGRIRLYDSEKNELAACEISLPEEPEKLEFYSLLFGFAWLQVVDATLEQSEAASVSG